ncbi:O-antigen ligase family protein [Humibacter albus]|uniref:O-antigen ligase family protein n=1 Tax=Humibacter albus TaxID=427754 RepID=UPI0003B6AAAE|nr:O-antigen ligase family protein [Humibacter albus]
MFQRRVSLEGVRPATLAVAVVSILVAVLLGVLSAETSGWALAGAIVVLLVGVSLRDPTIVPVLAVPATLIQARVGGLLSVADVVLAAATLFAVFMLRDRGAAILRPVLWAGTFYLATAIPTLILNRFAANYVEWAHEVVLVLGSLVVGFVIGRENRARLALSLYLFACCGIAIAAAIVVAQSLVSTGTLEPAYLPDLQKNTIGGMLAASAVIAFARPVWLGWSRFWAYGAFALSMLGVFAAQSRQGVIGAIIGVLIVSLRPRAQNGKRGKLIWFACIPAVAWVLIYLNAQLSSGNQFNSAHQRVDWYAQAWQIWQESPLFGVGMRYWYTDRFVGAFGNFQPPNAELEVLTTTGVFGLIGFFVMFAVACWYLYRMNPVYGTVGLAVVATRFVQAQFDLYWVAGQASLLWIVAGICFGLQARENAGLDPGPPAGSAIVRAPSLAAPSVPARRPVRGTERAVPSRIK